MILNKNKYVLFNLIFFGPFFHVVYLLISDKKKATVFSLIYFFVFAYISIKKNSDIHIEKKLFLISNKKKILIGVYFLFLILATQNYLLEYEIIDWDIGSYIVASNELQFNNIPYATQWESKGPILFYMYKFFLNLASGNLIYFKIISDSVLFLIAIVLFMKSLSITNKNLLISFTTVSVFILFMSQPFMISSYSEIYALLFLSSSIYLFFYKKNKYKYLISGFLLSLSTLVNQGTIIFLLPYLIDFLQNKVKKVKFMSFFTAFTLPHLFFICLYFVNDLFEVYLATFISIPLGYTSANYSNLYELLIFFKKFLEFNSNIYLILLSIFFISFRSLFFYQTFLTNLFRNSEIYFIMVSLLFYFIGSHNYYHHLIFFIYFLSLYIARLKHDYFFNMMLSFVLFGTIYLMSTIGVSSYKNINSLDTLYEEYPLRQLSEKIQNEIEGEYEILALDYNLILYYLDKPNFSYIVHGTNLEEPYIIQSLENTGNITTNYLDYLQNSKPSIVICSPTMIIRGEPTQRKFPCNLDHYPEYYQLDTQDYFRQNLNFYFDPYKEINVFLLK